MAIYYLLTDLYVSDQELLAGTTQATMDSGGVMPPGWPPPADVDPVDNDALAEYFQAGPRPRGLIRQQWTQFPVNPPKFVWTFANGRWSLNGITNLQPAPVFLTSESGIFLTSEDGFFLEAG